MTNQLAKFQYEAQYIPADQKETFALINEHIAKAWNRRFDENVTPVRCLGSYYVFGKNFDGKWTLIEIEKNDETGHWMVWHDAHSYHRDCGGDDYETYAEAKEAARVSTVSAIAESNAVVDMAQFTLRS